MTLQTFCHIFEVSTNNFYVMHNLHKYPTIAVKRVNKSLVINEKYFLKRQVFKKKMYDKATENYFILEATMLPSDIVKYMVSKTDYKRTQWNTWIYTSMWRKLQNGILSHKVSKYHIAFVRHTNALIRKQQC